jgi:GT2 family glycosyltransferase
MLPKVSIIILNWNQYQDTRECLLSLGKIDYPNYKIILVDNGSCDGSIDKIEKEFPRHVYIRNYKNLGFTGGNNVGIKRALAEGAEYVLLLNNDTEVKPDFLSVMVAAAEKDIRIGVVGPKIYYYDRPDVIWFAGGKINPLTGQTGHIGINQADNVRFDSQKEMEFITGCVFLAKTNVLKKTGLLDEDYFNNYEDVDLSVRIKKAGDKLLYVPQAVVFHKFAKAMGGRFSPFYIYFRVRNNLLFDLKNRRPWFHFLFHFFVSPLKHIIYGTLSFNFKGVRAAAIGWLDFVRGRYGFGSAGEFLK